MAPLSLFLVGCASYAPLDIALDALVSDDQVEVREERRYWMFDPGVDTDVGLIFYPGGLVQPEAYAAPLRRLAEAGVPTALVRMPSDLAVLAPQRADEVIDHEAPTRWVMSGHSLGGAMAASYAADTPVEGLALWAAYPPKSDDLSAADLPVLTVRGSEDLVLDLETYTERLALLPPDTVEVVIEGGNHAGFGDYGEQKNDGDATLTPAEQQQQTVTAMLDWMRGEGLLPPND